MSNITPVVRNIIFICVGVFILDVIFKGFYLTERMALYKINSEYFLPYQLFSYMFAHGDLGHLFFNMMALVFFGSMLELVWGFGRFLRFYLITGLGAAIVFEFLEYYLNPGQSGIMVGASGAIYGILVAFGFLFPDREVQLYLPPIRVKGKYLALALGLLGFFLDKSGTTAHYAHLGGAIIGFGVIRFGGA